MEPLWLRIRDIVDFAAAGDDLIENKLIIRATKKVLHDTSQVQRAIEMWDDKVAADQTWINFQTHFETANHRRLGTMTAYDAGLGGGHAANTPARGGNPAPASGVSTGRSYCWTHGYCLGSNHTSLTCLNKATGHRDDATIVAMYGGNNTIARKRDEPMVYHHPSPSNGANGATTPST